jgi:hypothetical protein
MNSTQFNPKQRFMDNDRLLGVPRDEAITIMLGWSSDIRDEYRNKLTSLNIQELTENERNSLFERINQMYEVLEIRSNTIIFNITQKLADRAYLIEPVCDIIKLMNEKNRSDYFCNANESIRQRLTNIIHQINRSEIHTSFENSDKFKEGYALLYNFIITNDLSDEFDAARKLYEILTELYIIFN